LRVGALALLGAGVLAGILGVVSLVTGADEQPPPVAAPSSSTVVGLPTTEPPAPVPTSDPALAAPTSAPAAPAPASAPAPEAGAGAPPAAAAAPNTPAAPAAAAPAAGGAGAGSGSGSGAERAPVRVYNNSTISGLAARAADDFRTAGWPVEDVANYPSGIIPTSTVYYRAGTSEQASAQMIGTEFGLRSEPRFDGLSEASPGLIVIVTDDYQQR
jgi:cytoskeletal protein RodZ